MVDSAAFADKAHRRERAVGVAAAVAAALAFAAMNLNVLLGEHRLHATGCLAARGVVGTLALLPWVWREVPGIFTARGWPVWTQCICGALAALALFHNVSVLSVGEAVALSYLAPIFVALAAPVVFRERFSPGQAVGVFLMAVGAVCLQLSHGPWRLSHSTWVGLGGAACGGGALLALKRAARAHSPMLAAWTFCLFSAVSAACLTPPWAWDAAELRSTWGLVLTVGGLGTLGQVFLSWSFKRLAAGLAGGLSLLTLVFSVLFESVYTSHWPSVLQLCGYLSMCLGLLWLRAQER